MASTKIAEVIKKPFRVGTSLYALLPEWMRDICGITENSKLSIGYKPVTKEIIIKKIPDELPQTETENISEQIANDNK